MIRFSILLTLLVVCRANTMAITNHFDLDSSIAVGWDSHYVLEGRDLLEGDSLNWAVIEFTRDALSGGIWYGDSPDRDYREWQFAGAYTHDLGEWELSASFMHLRFESDEFSDNEVGLSLSREDLPGELDISLDAYHSFEAAGSFWQVAVDRDLWEYENLEVEVAVILGINQGYIADGHDGLNHLAGLLSAEYDLAENLLLIAYTTYSDAINKDFALPGDQSLRDFWHFGLSLSWAL